MSSAPRGLRTHIGLFGRRNVGKSSVLNALTRQEVAIVSAPPGTTTDPVEKPMELLPLGPVLFIDTAGVDDEGTLGEQRVAKTRKALERINRARRIAFERALIAWKKREARKLELMKILRLERVEKLKAKFNLNRPPITMPVQERVAFFRMRREIGYKLPKQKLERETEEQAEFFPTANGPGPTGNSCPNGPANGQF